MSVSPEPVLPEAAICLPITALHSQDPTGSLPPTPELVFAGEEATSWHSDLIGKPGNWPKVPSVPRGFPLGEVVNTKGASGEKSINWLALHIILRGRKKHIDGNH